MDKIPVEFDFEGRKVKGTLDATAGAGGNVWHLMVENYYWGRLRKAGDAWYFDESKWKVADQIDHFAAVVIAWYQ